MSNRILNAPYDPGLSVCLASMNDLNASDGKYHLICLMGFKRKILKIMKALSVHKLAFLTLCNELEYATYSTKLLF